VTANVRNEWDRQRAIRRAVERLEIVFERQQSARRRPDALARTLDTVATQKEQQP
jgi:hypothetical protein